MSDGARQASQDLAPEHDQADCRLLSAGCTTGWTDWIHGELWLCPDGLLRRSLGLWRTIRHFNLPATDVRKRPTTSFSATEIGEILQGGRRNRWVPWDAIERAELGRLGLRLHMRDESRIALLLVPIDDVTPLRNRLPRGSGRTPPGRLTVRRGRARVARHQRAA